MFVYCCFFFERQISNNHINWPYGLPIHRIGTSPAKASVVTYPNNDALAAGVKQIVYTSLVNTDDPTNPSVEKRDHIFTGEYIKSVGLDYIFMRNSQYAEAMITNYFT